MNEEHDGTDQGNPSEEEYQRFRRMMDGMGRAGLRRMVERLTGRIEASPRDTEALSARALAYRELGEHRRAAEDNGRIVLLGEKVFVRPSIAVGYCFPPRGAGDEFRKGPHNTTFLCAPASSMAGWGDWGVDPNERAARPETHGYPDTDPFRRGHSPGLPHSGQRDGPVQGHLHATTPHVSGFPGKPRAALKHLSGLLVQDQTRPK